ncbi:hypothetical protein ACOSQ3_004182 [Xanthoceras sorbifolium]
MIGKFNFFHSYVSCSKHTTVKIADGSLTPVAGIGTIKLSPNMVLKSVLHVSALKCNLISVSKMTNDNQCVAKFLSVSYKFQELSSGRTIGSARVHDGLYYFETDLPKSGQAFVSGTDSVSVSSNRDIMLWHHKLGHPSYNYLKRLFPSLFNKTSVPFECEICQIAKHTRTSFPTKSYIPSTPFHLIHSDIWDPSKITTSHGKKWFITFIDDHTRITWVYLLREKSEACQIFKNFHNMIQNQFRTNI